MADEKDPRFRILSDNRQARHNYFLMDRFEAGMVLTGTEVKAAKDGKILWDFDTVKDYDTVNKVPGKGGSLDGPGPAIAGGVLVVNSGYAFFNGIPGNVLLAFGAR